MTSNWHDNYENGKRAFAEKKYTEAIKCLEAVVAEKASFADVFNMLGLMYYENRRHSDAVTSLKKALELNPRYTEAALNLAVVYNEMGEFELAQEAYGLAKLSTGSGKDTYLDPFAKGKLANMHAELGGIYKDLGMYRDAVEEYKKALALRPEFVDIKVCMASAYRDLKEYDVAAKALEEVVKADPRYMPARTQLGLTYYVMGKKDEAKTEWMEVLSARPDDKLANMYMNLLKDEKKK